MTTAVLINACESGIVVGMAIAMLVFPVIALTVDPNSREFDRQLRRSNWPLIIGGGIAGLASLIRALVWVWT